MKYNVEFAYYDPEGRKPFNGIYDEPINNEPIEAANPDSAIDEGWAIADDQIISYNQELSADEIEKIIDSFHREHIARAVEIEG